MKKAFTGADILLPDFNNVSAEKWAVIACDQFTSEPHYWESADKAVGDAPSTLRVILPEVYLSETEQRIPAIKSTMEVYMRDILCEHPDSMIYVERVQSDGSVRRGIVMAVDLECYDFRKGADSLIRATEATVIERIPPRVAIRRDAKIELPHVMLLIDDPERTVIEPLSAENCPQLAYDTDLMLGGGHITGRFLSEGAKAAVSDALDALITPEAMQKRYGDASLSPLLFAVGDGNHSLATAKTIYEELKETIGEKEASEHPARYALIEVVNIHDEALKFEPIYRVVFGVDPEVLLNAFVDYCGGEYEGANAQKFDCYFGENKKSISVKAKAKLSVGTLQTFLDEYVADKKDVEVDYIHGVEALIKLSNKENTIGFLFEGMKKEELFAAVKQDGSLPRKT
ncbi:MAG: DUF1015 domain-containing protein, partial [Clostridia bacterium]|nr:DUF1015 domain-containing protein [Clostridia bacterium]